jgi:hypothetical protein
MSVLFAVLAVLTLNGAAMAAGKSVPFKGRSSGVVTTTGFDPVAMIVHTRVEAQGQATHLGRFTATAVADIDVVTGDAHGTWTLTAANGDTLFVEFEASAGSGSTDGVGNFTITGGTGRFDGASGFYEQRITFEGDPGSSATASFTDVLEGRISYGHP